MPTADRATTLADDAPLDERGINRLCLLFLLAGVGIRLFRYLLRFPLYGDEAFLAANFIHADLGEFWAPLDFSQVAPIGFCWIEVVVTRLLGFSDLSLRLFPLLCGVASLFAINKLARTWFDGTARLFAVGVLSVGNYPVRYASEIKPYAPDLLIALLLLLTADRVIRRYDRASWIALAALAIAAPWFSFPALFIVAGVSAGLFLDVIRQPSRRKMAAWLTLNVIVAASAFALKAFVLDPHYTHAKDSMTAYWRDAFPPLNQPFAFIAWFLEIHTGQMMAYPVGEKNGGSLITTLLVAAGIATFAKRGWWTRLTLLLAPFLACFLAGAQHRYPYGGAPRLMQFAAPAICLLLASGAAALIASLREVAARRAFTHAALACLGVVAVGVMLQDLIKPTVEWPDLATRDYAKWLWNHQVHPDAIYVLENDLTQATDRPYYHKFAQGLCYHRMSSPGRRHHQSPLIELPAGKTSVDVIVHTVPAHRSASKDVAAWLAGLHARFRVTRHEEHHVNARDPSHGEVFHVLRLEPIGLASERR